LDQARQLLQRVVRIDPQHADAWHRLGLVENDSGHIEQAAQSVVRALSLEGNRPDFLRDLGALCLSLGRIDEAVDHLQQAVNLAPGDAELQFNLGVLLERQGNLFGARLRYQQATRLKAEMTPAWTNLGIIHQESGELDRAADCFETACRLAPSDPQTHFHVGNVRLALGRAKDAIAAFSTALSLAPRMVTALNNLGLALTQFGETDRALDSYRLAIRIDPHYAAPRNNLGALLGTLGRTVEAEACLRESLAVNGSDVVACNNLAGLLQGEGRLEEAESLLLTALAFQPQYPDALGNLAGVLQQQGRTEEARGCYQRSLALVGSPRLAVQAALMLPPVYGSSGELREARKNLATEVACLVERGIRLDPTRDLLPVHFYLAYQGFSDYHLQQSIERLFHGATAHETPGWAPHRDGRLRIGFASKFLRDHTIGDLMRGLITRLDRSEFHVTIFSIGEYFDETATAIRRRADAFVPLPDLVPQSRRAILDAGLDLLFYPEIGMDPLTYTLAHSRLAPVQCTTWGHPVTTSIPTIDAFLSSELLEEAGAARHYSEQLVLLKRLPTCYERPRLAGNPPTRAALGLPTEGTLYLCPQSLFKFHPDFDSILHELLKRDPTGQLVLIEGPHEPWTEAVRQRFAETIRQEIDRIHFEPRVGRAGFLQLVSAADVVLDPLHFGGGNTSYQALGLGIPIVTLPSDYLRGRVTLGCYRQMDFTDCVAETAEEYVAIALRLAHDATFRDHARSEIRRRSGFLFNDVAVVREIEQFFRQSIARVRNAPSRAA
jgi:predicted O-linked N-acetylglucosamine transferase (SPINDLY family)